MRKLLFSLISLGLGIALTGCGWFDDNFTNDIQPLELYTQGINYQLEWPKNLDKEIIDLLQRESVLVKLEHRPPISLAGLIKRCEKDQDSFKKSLASIGYFKGNVKFKIEQQKIPVFIEIQVEPGPRYNLGEVRINCNHSKVNSLLNSSLLIDVIHLKPGKPVSIEKILEGMERLKKYLQNQGYPFVEIEEPLGSLNHEKRTLDIIYKVKPESLARIESTTIEGLHHIEDSYIRNRLGWKDGEVYNQEKVDKSRRRLLETGLLSSINISAERSGAVNADYQPVKMIVKTTEGAARAIGAGIKFSSSEGIGGHAFWHHDNVKRHGQQLGASFRSSKREMKALVFYNIPDFGKPLHTLKNEALLWREHNRAYVGRTYSVGTSYECPLAEHLIGALGLVAEGGRIRRQDVTYRTRLIGVPTHLKIDYANDLLDPTSGVKVDLKVTPYYGRLGQSHGMVVGLTGLSAYLPFDTNEAGESRTILASFIKAGSIFNQPLEVIPPNKRFYAGGGGSIRGYGYQLVGPLDSQNIPEGGKSLAEIGTEIRFKTSDTIGFVAFIEGGTVTKGRTPEFAKHALWGTGAGFRYYSPLGPIRVDIALPLKRRKDVNGKFVDSAFQLYLSVGQAF